ncbi:MAG TPA: DUF3231 family protein [Bacillales bacterium]|nr:DUF3231 family protein [Bacillales bacterium]
MNTATMKQHATKLTAAEISQLWGAYMNDSMSSRFLEYFSNTVEDEAVAGLIEQALKLSQNHITELSKLLKKEHWMVPMGFTDADVNLDAPPLYSDSFVLFYLQELGTLGMNLYALSITLSARDDVRRYFIDCLRESTELFEKTQQLLLEKGLYIRAPYIPSTDEMTFVRNDSYLGGWFGTQRPLSAIEITNLYKNRQRNELGEKLILGFSQVAENEQVRSFMKKGHAIAKKHVSIFGSQMTKDNLPASETWDTMVSTSTEAPFSDKLMMFHTTSFIGLSISFYATAISTSLRKDLTSNYARLITEIMKYANDGAKIMIKNGWMEQPPQAADRDQLTRERG